MTRFVSKRLYTTLAVSVQWKEVKKEDGVVCPGKRHEDLEMETVITGHGKES